MRKQVSQKKRKELIKIAKKASKKAYMPYSNFAVGAALLLQDGTIVYGANVENASYSLGICAERVAIASAVINGLRNFVALAVFSPSSPPGAPCGACRQVIFEFAPTLPLILANDQGEVIETTLEEIFPYPFSKTQLESSAKD